MAITVNFYNFAKRQNSTAQPASTDLISTESCTLKAPTDLIRPTLLLELAAAPTNRTYAYIPSFARYYWIRTWRSINAGLWECDMEEDYLASWKSSIGAASKYVLRAASSADWDGSILDNAYPTKGGATVYNSTASGDFYNNTGTYVIGIVGEDPAGGYSPGPIAYYAMTEAQFRQLASYLLSSTDWLNIDPSEISSEMVKALFNPMQYIVSLKWFPFTLPTAAPIAINWAWWAIPLEDVSVSLITARDYQTPTYYINIPKHWQAATRGAYLNYAPYSRYTLEAGVFGTIPIDSLDIAGYTRLYLQIENVDYVSGQAALSLTVRDNNTTKLLSTHYAQLGVDIPVGQIMTDILGAATTAVNSLSSVVKSAKTGHLGQAALNLFNGIGDTVEAAMPQVSVSGRAGSRASIVEPILISKFVDIVDADDAELGRPVSQLKTLSTLSGFVQCADGDLQISGFPEERRELRRYLTTGFFYL